MTGNPFGRFPSSLESHTKAERLGRRRRATPAFLLFGALVLAALWPLGGQNAPAQTVPTSAVTVHAFECGPGDNSFPDPQCTASGELQDFTFIINEDNAHYASDPPDQRPSIAPTESHSRLVAAGDQDDPTVNLPDGRYLVSVRSPGHKLWGEYFTVDGAAQDVNVSLRSTPLKLGRIRVFVFNDNAWTNSAPDFEESGVGGFHVTIEEQTDSVVSVNYFNEPLCGGDCTTANDGFVELSDLGPATYFVYVTPPDGACNSNPDSRWVQTSTFDGGFGVQAGVEEGSDGSGAPGEMLWEPPNRRTGYWFGFVCAPLDFANPGTGEITGTARNWQGWPPFDTLIYQDPVENPYVTLADSATDQTVFAGQGDAAGNFDIQNVPAGTYTLSIWDEQLSYIIRFLPVTVGAGETVDVNSTDVKGESGVGVSRWFGWLSGDVYFDENRNQIRDPGEPGVGNTGVDQRWRDGSIKEETATDGTGHYEYPQAEGGALGKWIIGEQGFTTLGVSGPSVHDELDPSIVTPLPTNLGGALLNNQLLSEGHRAEVDWGKYAYDDGENGQIVGITFWATTRNEFDARFQAGEGYEPGIPDVRVNLEDVDGNILNVYSSDHWSQPPNDTDPGPDSARWCHPRDVNGNAIPNPDAPLNPIIGQKCLEVPINGVQSKDGAFDGGYAFADYCPMAETGGFDEATGLCVNGDDPGDHALVPGDYVTHVVMPKDEDDLRPCNPAGEPKRVSGPVAPEAGAETGCIYHAVREEDVNVDLGNDFIPAIPPPECAGDLHTVVIDPEVMPRGSPYEGQDMPLCDKRLIHLQAKQNANADFFLMTNQTNGVDVEVPGRIIGLVSDDIYFDTDQQSIWYGEPRPVANIPVGIRDYNWRLIKTVDTDLNGSYEAVLPSTETFNCPIPQGPCPGMYVVVVNDPGDKDNPNSNYNPNYLTASFAWDVWPGTTDQLDTPLDPISGTGCDLPIVNNVHTPELLQVSRPYVLASNTTAASRRITIRGAHFGTTAGSITLTDPRVLQSRTFTGLATAAQLANVNTGGIVSWADRQIVLQVPAPQLTFGAGQKQLSIRTAGSGGLSTTNGITIHVLGSGYNPAVIQVGPPTNPHAIQNAINTAGSDSLLVLQPGTYHENVILWKRVKLQGLGPGGIVGAPETEIQAQPEDPRFDIQGSVIDGRFFTDNQSDWEATLTDVVGSLAGVDAAHPVLKGADITVVAKAQNTYTNGVDANNFNAARIDGIGLTTGRGEGAGGIQLQAYARRLQISNDVLESNGGVFAGGIGVGQPNYDAHDENLKVAYSRLLGNGGLTHAGAMGIFRSSDNYDVGNSILCSNFSVEYGAGISHLGRSPGGVIHDNQIYYNDAVDSGGGLAIQQEIPAGDPNAGTGSGDVHVLRNLIQSNFTGDDGGGIFVANALGERIDVVNNMINNNGAAHVGGAITLDDASNVAIVNNTVANNVSTGSSENSSLTVPTSAGLASEANDPNYQDRLGGSGAPKFSNPVALFNNIFWNNEAFLLTQQGPGADLVSQGFIDFQIDDVTTPDSHIYETARYNLFTNGDVLQDDLDADGNATFATMPGGGAPIIGFPTNVANRGNIVGVDPLFIAPFINELTVSGSRLDPQQAAVTITGQDPPVGLTGNYHLQTGLASNQVSGAVDRGVRCSNTAVPPPANPLSACPAATPPATVAPSNDIDGQLRPQLRSLRLRTPWDFGADEVPTASLLTAAVSNQFRTQGTLTAAQRLTLKSKIDKVRP